MIIIDINKKGNGECPRCKKNKKCDIQEMIKKCLYFIKCENDIEMEMVIYQCPKFEE
jgi:hypothetical protein